MQESDVFDKLWKKRAALIKADPLKQQQRTDFPDYPSVTDRDVQSFCANVSAQLVLYRGRKGEFARDWIFTAAEKHPAYEWWEQHGSSVPELQTVACYILSQPSSASIIERINSEFAFVKDRRRNRLGHAKSNTLVALFHNLRLLKKMRKLLFTEQCVGWNDEDDKTGASFSQHCCHCSCLCLLASYPTPSFLLQASSNTASHTMSRRHRASAWPLRCQCARSWSSRQHRRPLTLRRMSRGWFVSIAMLVTQKGITVLDY